MNCIDHDSDKPASRMLVIGAAHVDRIGKLDRSAVSGASVPGHFVETAGGAALNVASNLAALGTTVSLGAIVGSDSAGILVREALDQRAIRSLLETDQAQTASYTAILQPDGDLVIGLADMDIHARFDPAKLRQETATLNQEDWLVVDANLAETALPPLMQTSASRAALSVSTAKAYRLLRVLRHLDVLFTNRREALAMAGQETSGTMTDALAALEKLPVSRAVISDANKPVHVLDGARAYRVPIPRQAALIDVTGAGDALAAGTLHHLAQGHALKDAVTFGVAAAQAIVQVNGPWRGDLREALHPNAMHPMKATPLA